MSPWTPNAGERRTTIWLGLIVVAATLALYWPVFGFDFVSYDDPEYVTDNAHVLGGLTGENVAWAFTESHAANWHPLTWLSHQLDSTLFGADPGPQHAVNVALHVANALLVLLLMGALGFSALAAGWIAALFALHPMHVESVAWISERKDVLSTFFGLLALCAYVGYVRSRSLAGYVAVTLALVLGLLSKPMLVTLPVLFLLLDYWPLARFSARGEARRGVFLEKLPWAGLAAASAWITLGAQEVARSEIASLGVPDRLRTAVVGLVRYLGKLCWPTETAVLYPHPYMPGGSPYTSTQVAGATALLVVLTAGIVLARRRGWTLVGWFWFLVVLVPVCGLVQVGSQAIADRYTYVSYIGLSILIAGLAGALSSRSAAGRRAVRVLGFGSIVACIGLARPAVGAWRDSETLFTRALEVEPDNPVLLVKLGTLSDDALRFDRAEAYFRRALERVPDMYEAQIGLATTLNRSGKPARAIAEYERAIAMAPEKPGAMTNLGLLLSIRGSRAKGLALLERAFELDPQDPLVLRNLGLGYQMGGEQERAVALLERAMDAGGDVLAARALGALHLELGRPEPAGAALERALERFPEDVELRWLCAEAHVAAGQRGALMRQLERVQQLDRTAAAAARAGRMLFQAGALEEAIRALESALELEPGHRDARAALDAVRRGR